MNLGSFKMADDAVRWHAPLKAPAVEVFSLLSDDEDSIGTALDVSEDKQNRDASRGDSDDDDQWSLYEDALDGGEDEELFDGSMIQCVSWC